MQKSRFKDSGMPSVNIASGMVEVFEVTMDPGVRTASTAS
jgi:hypothetical protein